MNFKMHMKAIEKLYDKKCDIAFWHTVKNLETRENERIREIKYESQPCHLSREKLSSYNQSKTSNDVIYINKLNIAPEFTINQGDEVIIDNVTYEAGEPFVYPTHQVLTLTKKGKA